MRISKVLLSLTVVFATPVYAFEFDFENEKWTASLDNTITYSAQWRLNKQSHNLLKDWQQDDSNRNFDKGLVSNSIRFLSEFELGYSTGNGNTLGLFTRVTGYYDDELANADTDYSPHVVSGSQVTANNAAAPDTLVDTMNSSTTYDGSTKPGDFHDDTVERNGRGGEFLDFFVYAQLGSDSDHPISLKIGKQVISWGESAFIQNGISAVMNGADVNKAVQPGMEVKEILRPLGAVYGSISLTENLTFQTYYQYEWDHIVTPAYGSYLNAMPDFLNTDGGEALLVPTDLLAEFVYFRGNGLVQDEALFTNSHIAIERLADEDASDDGQWGVAFNWYLDEFFGTEFGFYFLNYHRKLPDLVVRNYGGRGLSQTYGGVSNPGWTSEDYFKNPFGGAYYQECSNSGALIGQCLTEGLIADAIDVGSFNVKYYEDVKLYGFSWNTVIPATGTAFSGEIALHHGIPVQTVQAFQGLLDDSIIGCHPAIGVNPGAQCETELSSREDVVVMQWFLFHDFANFTFADDVGLFMEIGWIHAVDLDDGKLRTPFAFDSEDAAAIAAGYFDAGSSPVPGPPANTTVANGGNLIQFPVDGFSSQELTSNGNLTRDTAFIGNSPATKDSFGYQMIWAATWYNGVGRHIDALTGTDLVASFSFRHDFEGTSVIPGTGFTEGQKAASISLEASWQNTWAVTVDYTNFFGHSTDSLGLHSSEHPLDDRDFVSLAVKYRF